MNVEQAINKMQTALDVYFGDYPGLKHLYESAFQMAIDALRRQEPLKPSLNQAQTKLKPSEVNNSYVAYYCKNCCACVGVWSVNHEQTVKSKYCQNCGQKQDWSESE